MNKRTFNVWILLVLGFLWNSLSATENTPDSPAGLQQFQNQLGPQKLQAWQTRLDALNQDIAKKGILLLPGEPAPLLTGYAYKEFYDWDLYFENLYLSYNGISDYCFTNFKGFLSREKPDGFIQRSFGLRPCGAGQPFKPFLAQIAILGSQQRGNDYEWLRGTYYEGLKKYLDRWFAYDKDHNGLPTWASASASGMDNQNRRVGSHICEGADLASYLHRELESMAVIAGKLGYTQDQKDFQDHATKLAQLVNDLLWDDKDGFYYDRDEKTGQPIRLKSIAGFMPLWAGIATPERAKRLIEEHLTNPKEFWLPYPIATYAATEPDFYEGRKKNECNWQGTAWVPTNYMVMHGLLRYGYKELARDLANRTLEMALEKNPVTREFYDSDTGKGNGMNPFWGWSSLAYVMPLEVELNYDPTDPQSQIVPWLSQNFGVTPPHPSSSSPPVK